ncbi:hypothetical protein BOW57_09775 [Flavobacterium sp. YO64]|nr:hypothetical protein BOW57_09775 [Flavobacterium sp. YO64]
MKASFSFSFTILGGGEVKIPVPVNSIVWVAVALVWPKALWKKNKGKTINLKILEVAFIILRMVTLKLFLIYSMIKIRFKLKNDGLITEQV